TTSASCTCAPLWARTCRGDCCRWSRSSRTRRSVKHSTACRRRSSCTRQGSTPISSFPSSTRSLMRSRTAVCFQERRRALHARLVAAIEAPHRDRLGEQIERLAHHALRGELQEKAVAYLRQAGNKAVARSALSEARGWFEQALGVLDTLSESPSTLEQSFEIR